MPIEIRELVIRAVVEPRPEAEAAPEPALDRARLVQQVVDEVLKALRRDRAR
jgi:hypothetical protein